jgi:hypothetical protein
VLLHGGAGFRENFYRFSCRNQGFSKIFLATYRQTRADSPAASPSYAAVRAPVHTASIGRWQRYADLLPELLCPRAS